MPREVRDEVEGARAHYAAKERCLFCDIMRQEDDEGRRVVAENARDGGAGAVRVAVPFETWILPRRHQSRFEDVAGGEVAAVARMLRRRAAAAGQRARAAALLAGHPQRARGGAADFYHWHIEDPAEGDAVRRFEWATGFHLNPTLPGDRRQGPARGERERDVAGYASRCDVAAGLQTRLPM